MLKYFKLLDSVQSQYNGSQNLKTIMRVKLDYYFGAGEESSYIIRKWEEEKAATVERKLIAQLEKAAKNHDWWYMMSDDHEAYRKGVDESQEMDLLDNALKKKGMEKQALAIIDKHVPDQLRVNRGK